MTTKGGTCAAWCRSRRLLELRSAAGRGPGSMARASRVATRSGCAGVRRRRAQQLQQLLGKQLLV
jgi:hypothetical protein